jgi:PDZ domain
VREDKNILELSEQFVLLRMTYLRGVNLAQFGYDYDQTFMTFFLDPEGRIYSRYGSRTASSPEALNSVDGLLYTMNEVLKAHKEDSLKSRPAHKLPKPKEPADIPALTDLGYGGSCVRCHMVHEAQFAQKRKDDGLGKGDFWLYPPPDNIGLRLDKIEGNLIREVVADSFAAKAGLKVGDRLRSANGTRVVSRADLECILNGLEAKCKLALVAERDGKKVTADLELEGDWRRWDVSWRMSVRRMGSRFSFADALSPLTPIEKAKLDMAEDKLALRVATVAASLRDAGLQQGDVIVAFDGQRQVIYRRAMYYPLLEHIKGDKMAVTFLRDGKEQTATVVIP